MAISLFCAKELCILFNGYELVTVSEKLSSLQKLMSFDLSQLEEKE